MVPPCNLRLKIQYHSHTCTFHDHAGTYWCLPARPTFIRDSEIVADVVEGGDIRLFWVSGVLECHNVPPLKGSIRQEIVEVPWLHIQALHCLANNSAKAIEELIHVSYNQ